MTYICSDCGHDQFTFYENTFYVSENQLRKGTCITCKECFYIQDVIRISDPALQSKPKKQTNNDAVEEIKKYRAILSDFETENGKLVSVIEEIIKGVRKFNVDLGIDTLGRPVIKQLNPTPAPQADQQNSPGSKTK